MGVKRNRHAYQMQGMGAARFPSLNGGDHEATCNNPTYMRDPIVNKLNRPKHAVIEGTSLR